MMEFVLAHYPVLLRSPRTSLKCLSFLQGLNMQQSFPGTMPAEGADLPKEVYKSPRGARQSWSKADHQLSLALCLPSLAETRWGWELLCQPCSSSSSSSSKSGPLFQTGYFYVIIFTQFLLTMWENNPINFHFKICLRNVPSVKFGMSNTFLWIWFLRVFI